MCDVINPATENTSKIDQMFYFDRLNILGFFFFSSLVKCPAVMVILLVEMCRAQQLFM